MLRVFFFSISRRPPRSPKHITPTVIYCNVCTRRYADLLQKKLDTHGTQCFLINTGWTGGGYGVGKRMSIKATRACVNSVLDGSINKTKFTADPVRAQHRCRPRGSGWPR